MAFNMSYHLITMMIFSIYVLGSCSELSLEEVQVVRKVTRQTSKSVSNMEEDGVFYYNQTLDHFNYNPESYTKFRQRYLISSMHWGGAKLGSPIFAYLGAEAPLEYFLSQGLITDLASRFTAQLVFIEHRFYGESIPFGMTLDEALQNVTVRGYFNSAQALADYAELLVHIKNIFSSQRSPIIVFGESYGGMLASWFRLKYPHIAIGALASSAPVLYFDNITPEDGYYSVVTKDFKDISISCYETIRMSWSEIDRAAAIPNGLSILSQKFKTCSPLKSSNELKKYLIRNYASAAQYDAPPYYPVRMMCGAIDGSPKGRNILDKISAGVAAYNGYKPCFGNSKKNSLQSQTKIGWKWQRCTEMVMPIGVSGNNTMFPHAPFNITEFINYCNRTMGVTPRLHWVTTTYGGHGIKKVFRDFASNIILSNGLRDPYSIGGVLEDISETIHAVTTPNGSHCLDMALASESDPEWLKQQRKTEERILEGWLKKNY